MTRLVQRFQAAQQRRIMKAIESSKPLRIPLLVRVKLRAGPAKHSGSGDGIWGTTSAAAPSAGNATFMNGIDRPGVPQQ